MTPGTVRRSGRPCAPGRRAPFVRQLVLRGWRSSSWGYDPTLECFWAHLCADDERTVRIEARHLISTVPGLARAVARTAQVPPAEAYLALTG